MKKIYSVVLLLTLLVSFAPVRAAVDQSTVAYLQQISQNAWTTQALVAAGVQNVHIDYLAGTNPVTASDYAKTILALAAAGKNPAAYNGKNFLTGLSALYQSNQLGDLTLLSDDFWGLLALGAAGVGAQDTVVTGVRQFIASHQNSDGGWSYAPATESDTNDTAAAVMALVEGGLAASNAKIQSAITYLRNQQNTDGGFAFTKGFESDSASDAWVIAALKKVGVDAASWQVNGKNPVTHLESLRLDTGAFTWVASNRQANPLMTAYAAVALSGKSFPVLRYTQEVGPLPVTTQLRIEAPAGTLCDTAVLAATALEILEKGAALCNYTYQVVNTTLGKYVQSVNGVAAAGNQGWLYRVNWQAPAVGAADYSLQPGDYVMWSFGKSSDVPIKLTLATDPLRVGQERTATVEHFDTSWHPTAGAQLIVGSQHYTTDAAGHAVIAPAAAGSYNAYAEKTDAIRSSRVTLTVVTGASQTVDLSVNIDNPIVGGDSIGFIVTPDAVTFGTLKPGQSATGALNVKNIGQTNIRVEAAVSGDALFQQSLSLNAGAWADYEANLNKAQDANVQLALAVPQTYQDAGQKTGQLIFWASAR
ncbi:MAG: DUF4430 domain-containing protein [Patescibacteria group bacterium]